jgi:hypothetical protein
MNVAIGGIGLGSAIKDSREERKEAKSAKKIKIGWAIHPERSRDGINEYEFFALFASLRSLRGCAVR